MTEGEIPMPRNFMELLEARWVLDKYVCVGLDSDLKKIPKSEVVLTPAGHVNASATIFRFNQAIVRETAEYVCAYKPNLAFYLAQGIEGLTALEWTVQYIKEVAPDIPVILDPKWGDIGNTNNGYLEYAFEVLGVDAITVQPYLGEVSLRPFLERSDKGIFVLARTSNPGAGELQDIYTGSPGDEADEPLYKIVARHVSRTWNKAGNCGLVFGATYPDELRGIRIEIDLQQLPLLLPGIGAQGGDVEKTVRAAKSRFIVNSSRGIIFASKDRDFASVARTKVIELNDEIVRYL